MNTQNITDGSVFYRIENAIKIFNYCFQNNVSINKAELDLGFYEGFIKKIFKSNSIKESSRYFELVDLKNKYISLKPNKTAPTIVHKVDVDKEEKYDNRSTWIANRDENNKIIDYSYTIYIRDEKPFVGKLTREELDKIYELYSHSALTASKVSAEFKNLTFIDFKRILRCFGITKESATPFSIHQLEEMEPNRLADLTIKNKAKNVLRKIVERRQGVLEQEFIKSQERIYELETNQDFIKESLKDYFSKPSEKHNIVINYNKPINNKALLIYLSDLHLGASNDFSQFSKEFNIKIVYERFHKILLEINKQKNLYGYFDNVSVISLGDNLDGFNSLTTRGGHELPQNMNNKEQFKSFLDLMRWFFGELKKLNLSSNPLSYYSVGEDNHSGDFGYNANLALKYIFEKEFGDINFVLFDKYIEHFNIGDHVFIASHGKDKKHMKNNLPFHLDQKTDLFFVNYMKMNKIKSNSVIVIKGDLHQYSTEIGKNFRYTNIPSIYGGSPWTDLNFGYTQPGFVCQVLDMDSVNITETYLALD